MRSRAVLLLVLAIALGLFAYQQATRWPRYTPPGPMTAPQPAAVLAAQPAQPPEADLAEIERAIADRDVDRVEPRLRELHGQFPGNARILTQLARLEYHRATAGRSQPRNRMFMNHDDERLQEAYQWAARAVAIDPGLAGAWLVNAEIALARTDPKKSLEMLGRAEALDPDSPRLRFLKGDAFRALATYERDASHLPRALEEYRRILQEPIDSEEEFLALRQMGETWAIIGDDTEAIDHMTRAIDGLQGRSRAFALESRARIHLEAGRADAAIKDSQAAQELMPFGAAAHTLADAQLVKAGLAMRDGREAAAAPFLDAFLAYDSDPTPHVNQLASMPTTFPAVYAVYAKPMRALHWERVVPEALREAAPHITGKDLRKLAALGARFDGGDQATSVLLFQAIAEDNVEAVRTLLALGADTSVRREDGASLLDVARIGTRPERTEIRRLLIAKMGRPPGWTDTPVDLPTPGRWYRAERTVGSTDIPPGKPFEAGRTLLAGTPCSVRGKPFTCITFYTAPDKYYGSILIPLSSPEDFNALREVEPPAL